MKRRNFLTTSIGGGALISSAVPVVAQSAQSLSLLTNEPRSANALKARIETTTGGTMSLDVQAVTNADASGLLDRVGNGDANMCLVSLDHFLEKNLAFGMFASMPFGMTTGELSSWILASDGRDMLEELGAEYGVSIHLLADHGNLPMWSKAPIADAASLAGLSIGSTGLGILSLQAAGVASVADLRDPSVDWTGLDVIDGASVVEMQEKGLLETFTNISSTNPNKPSTLSALVVNNATMAAFSENEAVTVVRACSAELTDSAARVFHEGAVTFATLGDAITAYDLPQDVWGAINTASRSVLKDIFDSGGLEASVVDAYIYFLTDVSAWSDIGEAAYFTGRKRLTAV